MPAPHGGVLAEEDAYKPTYSAADLDKALVAERAAEASAEHAASDDPVALADLAVRRRFVASLELCAATGRLCPPRLDDPPWNYPVDAETAKPPLDAPLRFDLEDWQKIAAELHGRACACRTIACVDSLDVAIAQLEQRPMQDVRGDETASESITRARECLYRLRGKTATPRPPEPLRVE